MKHIHSGLVFLIIYEMFSRLQADIVLLINQSMKEKVRDYIRNYMVVSQSETVE